MAKIIDIVPKATLCLQEIICVRDILRYKQADETCSRLLGIYIAMRMDDLTLLLESYANQKGHDSDLSAELKKEYNDHFRKVRDKIGSHFQKTEEGTFFKIEIFRSFDYMDVVGVVDDANIAYQLLTGNNEPTSILFLNDVSHVNGVLQKINMDGTAHLGNDTLALGSVNTGAMFSLSESQRKAQDLRSIQLLVQISSDLCQPEYESNYLKNIFKRLLIAQMVNFWDNLVTRTDIHKDADQYEEGFDILYRQLITDNDNREDVEKAFDNFELKYPNFDTKMKKIRRIREHACAHFDRNSSLFDIQAELDSIDVKSLLVYFKAMLSLFEYIVNHVFLLQICRLQPRVPLYGSTFETVHKVDFYQNSLSMYSPHKMTVDEMFHAIYKGNDDASLAKELLKSIINFHDQTRYYDEILPKLVERFLEPSLSDQELCEWINFLDSCKNGFPERLMDLAFILLPKVNNLRLIAILWLFSRMHIDGSDKKATKIINASMECDSYIVKAFALMAELNSHSNVSGPVDKNFDTDINETFRKHVDSIKQPIERLSVLVSLCANWFEDVYKGFVVSKKKKYSEYLIDELNKAIDCYGKYIRLSVDDLSNLHELSDKHLFIYMNYYLTVIEKERKQKVNKFQEMFKYNAFPRNGLCSVEEIYLALNYEEAGDYTGAFSIMNNVVKDNPFNSEFQKCLVDLTQRHEELECKYKELAEVDKILKF